MVGHPMFRSAGPRASVIRAPTPISRSGLFPSGPPGLAIPLLPSPGEPAHGSRHVHETDAAPPAPVLRANHRQTQFHSQFQNSKSKIPNVIPRTFSLARLTLVVTALCLLCGFAVNFP